MSIFEAIKRLSEINLRKKNMKTQQCVHHHVRNRRHPASFRTISTEFQALRSARKISMPFAPRGLLSEVMGVVL